VPVLPTERQELFAHGLAKKLKPIHAARNAGFTGSSISVTASRLAHDANVLARVEELKLILANVQAKAETMALAACVAELPAKTASFIATEVRERTYRLNVLQDVVDRLRMVIDERAAAGRAIGEGAAPGASTGLLVRTLKSLRDGKKVKIHESWEIDGVTIQKLYDGLKQAAIEAGEWQEEGRVLPPATVDVSDLTDEQLFEEQRILREARERLEANRAGKPIQKEIQAAPGSVVSGDVVDSVVVDAGTGFGTDGARIIESDGGASGDTEFGGDLAPC
jgi:hypothetical protein